MRKLILILLVCFIYPFYIIERCTLFDKRSGNTLITPECKVDYEKNRLWSIDTVIFITADRDTLYGRGFEGTVDLKEWKILK